MKANIYLSLFCIMFFSGCASQELDPTMIQTCTAPTLQVQRDPEADFSKYKNFSVCPISSILEEAKLDSIVEKQLLFMARNCLEGLCYNYVDSIVVLRNIIKEM